MGMRDTIDSKTAGETILLAANRAVLDTPSIKNHFALIALVRISRWVEEDICQPSHNNMVRAATVVGEKCEHVLKQAAVHQRLDKWETMVYQTVMEAAFDFAQTLDYNLSMEAPLPF